MYIHTCIHTYVRTYMRTCTHTYTHFAHSPTHSHARMYAHTDRHSFIHSLVMYFPTSIDASCIFRRRECAWSEDKEALIQRIDELKDDIDRYQGEAARASRAAMAALEAQSAA